MFSSRECKSPRGLREQICFWARINHPSSPSEFDCPLSNHHKLPHPFARLPIANLDSHAIQTKYQNRQCFRRVCIPSPPGHDIDGSQLTLSSTGDHWNAMSRMVHTGNVDIITGDWLSEMNIAWNAITKKEHPELGYESGFLTQLEDCIDDIVAKGLKVVTNAGALNTPALTSKVAQLCQEKGHGDVVVACVVGDDISHLLTQPGALKTLNLSHLYHVDQSLEDWELRAEVRCAVAYLGARGIIAALNAGADIVICGRVTDASPVIGAAAWWYGWEEDSFDELAGALIAGREFYVNIN